MVHWETGKTEYTEVEAADALGLSLEELRSLVRQKVVAEDPDSDGVVPTYRPTDLLLLRMLSRREPAIP